MNSKDPASERLERAIMRRKMKLGSLKDEDKVQNDGLMPMVKPEKKKDEGKKNG